MADPHVVSTLQRKRQEIENVIAGYEKKLKEARTDLAHVNATLRLFELGDQPTQFPAYVDTLRLFKRGEIVKLCLAALAAEGPLDTRELAVRVVRAKGFDETDTVLRVSIGNRVVQAMLAARKHGRVRSDEKRAGVRLWSVK